MVFLFCTDPLLPRQVDECYEREARALDALKQGYARVDLEALAEADDLGAALRFVPKLSELQLAVYRGWMLRPTQYDRLYAALESRGLQLINDPAAYKHCHFFPEAYSIIAPHTAKSVWVEASDGFSMDRIMSALEPFGSCPIILKDYVKSQKHYWSEACYIRSASDRTVVNRVVTAFLELQGADLAGGLVFREFVRLTPLGTHRTSGMPLSKEFRLFWLDGQLVFSCDYWEDAEYAGGKPPSGLFEEVARSIRSRFFTMDVAQLDTGEWIIIELGDAQVAGLPEDADVPGVYQALVDRLSLPQPET